MTRHHQDADSERPKHHHVMRPDTRRLWLGAWYGVIATAAMGVVMALVWVLGRNTLPEPVPLGLVSRVLARITHHEQVTWPFVVAAVPVFFAYGALWGALLGVATLRITWWVGAALGLGLWLILMIFWLPLGGAQTFALATNPWMWGSTLVLHLIYGGTLGALVGRHPISEASLQAH